MTVEYNYGAVTEVLLFWVVTDLEWAHTHGLVCEQ